jgi:hypothetical protein
MSQRTTNLSFAVLGLGAVSLVGCLLRWAIDATGMSPQGTTPGLSFAIGTACVVLASLSFALAEQWPVRIGGLGLLLGLGLIANLSPVIWLGMLFVSCCLLLAVAVVRKMNPG